MPHTATSDALRRRLSRRGYEIFRVRDAYPEERTLHHHDFYEVNLIWSGSLHYHIESRSYHLTNGDILLISPDELHQPDPEGAYDLLEGVIAIRRLHTRVLAQTGLSTADEMLYPENYRYLSDLLSYVAVGARSVENQQHRLVASGIEAPVGMKNPTGGDLSIMMNAIKAGQHKHTFIYRGWEVKSEGNPYAHAIMRGYTDFAGKNVSNYHYEDLVKLYDLYQGTDLVNPAAVIDCNHANSGKKPLEQVRIAKEIVHSCNHNADIRKMVKGLMIESYIEDGAQGAGEHIYGKSITDPCLGWDKTEKLILELADRL